MTDDRLTIDSIRVFVSELSTARQWYVDKLGLDVVAEHPGESVLVLSDGQMQLIVEAQHDAESRQWIGRFTGVSLRVTDIEAVCARLADDGVSIVAAPTRQYWGGTLATIADSDNNRFQLVEYEPG